MSLDGKVVFVSGGSRGIGLAIARRLAADGARVALAAKTAEPHPKLPGTVFTAAESIEADGGEALPIVCDIRDEAQVEAAIAQTVDRFGGLDIVVNNASAVSLTDTANTPIKRFDLMFGVNTRGTFLVTQQALPWLERSSHAHVLSLSPPLDLQPKWFAGHVAYSIAKYGMSLCVLGMAEEFRERGIAVNALWPLTAIDTAAIRNVIGSDEMARACRHPDIVADAAYAIVSRDPAESSGNFFIDEEVLRNAGVDDFSKYAHPDAKALVADFFVPDAAFERSPTRVLHAMKSA